MLLYTVSAAGAARAAGAVFMYTAMQSLLHYTNVKCQSYFTIFEFTKTWLQY